MSQSNQPETDPLPKPKAKPPHPYLRVKIKALAAEARIIRHEEKRYRRGERNNETFYKLQQHRVHKVRPEARSALLAYAFLRGKPYLAIEQKCYEKPNPVHIAEIASRFSPQPTGYEREAIKTWLEYVADEAAPIAA